MSPESGLRLPTKLALMVIGKEISLDEALVKAHTSDSFSEFIQAIHDLVGVVFLDPEFLADRINTGICQRALEGHAPLLTLPNRSELGLKEGPDSDSPEEPEPEPETRAYDRARAELLQIEVRLARAKNERNEVLVRYQLLESTDRNAPIPPDPSAGPTLILLATFGFVVVSFYFLEGAMKGYFMGICGILGVFLSVASFIKGRRRYRIQMDRYRWESEERHRKMRLYTEKIEYYENSLHNIRRLARRALDREEGLTSDQFHQLQKEFPLLFKAELLVD